ncbi:MAG TPA: hypothetical protein VFC71_03875 [Candidatus Polarisedimenticolia bacterium]|nr:hypothetical protein [Candidatus Polarisedimenticolia bacterium]
MARTVRWLAWSVGILFLVGTALQLVDALNLYATPPAGEPANMVEGRLGSYGYRVAIWPVFFLSNLSFGVAFVALTGLGFALASWLPSGDARRIGIATSLGVAGILGAAGQLIIIGAAKATIDIQYCDCGFRDTEIVSQIWAQMIAEGAAFWLINGGVVLSAIGIIAVASAFREAVSPTLNVVGWVTAVGLVAGVVIPQMSIGPQELGLWLQVVVSGVLVPVWVIWLGLALAPRGAPEPA